MKVISKPYSVYKQFLITANRNSVPLDVLKTGSLLRANHRLKTLNTMNTR